MDNETKVTVVVLSYNRPRMLKEALASIKGADEVILCDDGSDFNIGAQDFPKFTVINAPKITKEQRLTTQRIGSMVNMAIKESSGDVIGYLCDDDLFAHDWIVQVKKFFAKYPKEHVIAGKWGVFNDGDVPRQDKQYVVVDENGNPGSDLITGNFMHRRLCCTEEGAWWPTDRLVCHDAGFLDNMHSIHNMLKIPRIEMFAGYRRVHEYNFFNFLEKDSAGLPIHKQFSDAAKEVILHSKFLE